MLNCEEKVNDQFPHGLRVLVVDDNVNYLKLLFTYLCQCKYKVRGTTKANQALEVLRKKKDVYDILITEAQLLDMDGFELAKIVSHEIGIPVIMISESDDKKMVMKSVINGARDYLVKPIRMEELRNIWQHVYRKKLFDAPRVKSQDTTITMKRERENENVEYCPPKKSRLSWTKDLRDKFISIVNELGSDAVPNKILEFFNEPNLSREHVASHLQKYRSDLNKEKLRSAEINNEKQFQPQNSFLQQDHLPSRMVPTNKITMTFPTSATIHQESVASTSALTPSIWNKFFPNMNFEYAVLGRGSTINNDLNVLQPYQISLNSFDVANVPIQPPLTNHPTSSLMAIPVSNSCKNDENVTNFDTSYMRIGTSTIDNPLNMESGALATLDENEWWIF